MTLAPADVTIVVDVCAGFDSAEMPRRKGAAGTGLQVFLESQRGEFVREFDGDEEGPGAE
jgi:hypothetical protein